MELTRNFPPPWPGPRRGLWYAPSALSLVLLAVLAMATYQTIWGLTRAAINTPSVSSLQLDGWKGRHVLADGMTALSSGRPGTSESQRPGLSLDPCLSLEDVRQAHAPQHHIFVAVPLHFSNEGLPDLLRSLAMQQYPNLTVVVYDDAAPDGSGELLAQEEARGTLPFELTVIRSADRLGPAHGRWELMRHIVKRAGPMDLVMFLDGDGQSKWFV